MSWQCPICETVNQDVTPVCTVCDHLAPVIESYLSIENIQLKYEYNEKLDLVHALEVSRDYEAMLNAALDALTLYKENGLAVEKAKHALFHLNQKKLQEITSSLLDASIDKKDYITANSILNIIENLSIDNSDFWEVKKEINSQLEYRLDIDKILEEAYKLMVMLDIKNALQIIEDGLKKYPTNKLLQIRCEDIKKMSKAFNGNLSKKKLGPKYPAIQKLVDVPDSSPTTKEEISSKIVSKRKFPKINRKIT